MYMQIIITVIAIKKIVMKKCECMQRKYEAK
jgi:hypothetical protein